MDNDELIIKDSRRNPVFKNLKVNRAATHKDKKNHRERAKLKHTIQREVDRVDAIDMNNPDE